jgi:hypothetical protein
VHVLQHDDATGRGRGAQQPQQRLAEQRPRRRLTGQCRPLRHEPAQDGGVRAEQLPTGRRRPRQRHRDLGPWAQGCGELALDAPADDRREVARGHDDLAGQPGLADTRLPRHEHGPTRAAARGRQRGGEHRHLGGPPHEHGAANAHGNLRSTGGVGPASGRGRS